MNRKVVGARELKTRLGKYLRAVRGGATIIVTERGEPVAELRPVTRTSDSLEAKLEAMAAKGLLTMGTGEPLPPFRPVRVAGPPVSETIIEEREDRF